MQQGIPKKIIQTDKSFGASPLARGVAANLKLLNPEYEYCFFDDEQVRRFVEGHFPQYLELYLRFPVKIQRFDFFRYLAIFEFGGFYFDTDLLLSRNLDDLCNFSCVLPFERLTWSPYLRNKGMHWEVGNYAFGATPRHPFIKAVIDNCLRAQVDHKWREEALEALPRALRSDLYVIYTTGPGLVSRTLSEYSNKEYPIKVLFPRDICDKEQWNQFGDHGVHLMRSSWRAKKGFLRRKFVDFLGIRNEQSAMQAARRSTHGSLANTSVL